MPMDTSIVKIISAELLFVYEFNSNKFVSGVKRALNIGIS